MNVKEYFLSLIKDKSNIELLNLLNDLKIINEKNILRYCICYDYYKLLKHQTKSCFEIKMDLSDKYNTTFDFVYHAIYDYSYIKI